MKRAAAVILKKFLLSLAGLLVVFLPAILGQALDGEKEEKGKKGKKNRKA